MALDRRKLAELAGLLAAVAFVMGMAYLPHADALTNAPDDGPALVRLGRLYWDLATGEAQAYNYTVHVDENMHWSRMASIERAESVRAEGIYDVVPETGQTLQLRGLVHERGFFVALVHLHQLTGIEWMDIIHALPALWAGLTAFLVWAALRPWPAAPVAAALVGLIPTSARFLGPGFLVPIGFGMAWIAAAFILLPHTQRVRGAATMLVLVTVWAFFIHLIAGFAVLILLLVSIPLQGRNFRSFALLTVTAALPLVVLLNFFEEGIDFEIGRLTFLPIDFTIFDQIGLPFLVMWAIGTAAVLTRRRAADPHAILLRASAIASIAALLFIVVAVSTRTLHYALYDRWHQPFVMFATIPAAAGILFLCEGALALWKPWQPQRAARPAVLAALLLVGLLLTASSAVAGHLREPYYHVLDDADWEGFQWAAQHVGPEYDVFLVDPWKAPIFQAMTGKTPYVYLVPGSPVQREDEYRQYLRGDGQNAVWLAEREITLVFDERNTPVGFERTSNWTAQLPERYAVAIDELEPR